MMGFLIKEILDVRKEIMKRTKKSYLLRTKISFPNDMSSKQLGIAYPTNKISFNKIAMSKMNRDDIKKVIIHEFFHIIAFHEYPNENIGHSARYKGLLLRYGFDVEIGKSRMYI